MKYRLFLVFKKWSEFLQDVKQVKSKKLGLCSPKKLIYEHHINLLWNKEISRSRIWFPVNLLCLYKTHWHIKKDKMFQLVLYHMKMHLQLINKMVHSGVHRYINHVTSTNSASRHLFHQLVACLLIQKKHISTTYPTTKLLENITVLKYYWLENIVWFYAPDIVWFCCT